MIYKVSHKTLIGTKPLRIRFGKIDEFIRIYDGTRYLTLFGFGKYDATYNRMVIKLEKNQQKLVKGGKTLVKVV